MKLNITHSLFLIAIVSLMYSCSGSKVTGETNLKSKTKAGTVYVNASGYGKTKSKAVNNAIKNAFKNILINGIPDSNQNRPMLGTNAEDLYDKNKNYFTQFFKTDYEHYILSRDVSRFRFFKINEPSINVSLLVNTNALRKHLEKDSIIRKLGL